VKNETSRQLVAHRDYSSITSDETIVPMILQGIFGIFHGISKLLFVPQFVTEPWLGNSGLKGKTVKV
jgi:hypothetical protein